MVVNSAQAKPLKFELPDSPVRGFPLYAEDRSQLHLGLVEVGCRPKSKRTQLKGKRQLICKHWGDHYRRKTGWELVPVFRMLTHYDPTRKVPLDAHRSNLDVVVEYSHIPKELLEALTGKEKRKIYRTVARHPTQRHDVLQRILHDNDADGLHNLIVNEGRNDSYDALRGIMAEIVAIKDLQAHAPDGMHIFWSEIIRFGDWRYPSGTQIDGVQTFYGEETYVEHVEALRKLDHLKIKDRWH